MGKSILDHKTLVLNKHWKVVATTTVKDAVVLMCRGSAYGICMQTFVAFQWEDWIDTSDVRPVTEHFVKSVSLEIPAPECILLAKYGEVFQDRQTFTYEALYRRDNGHCQYCGKKIPDKEISIDHIIPRSKGGPSSFTNCVLSCMPCNTKKANHLMEEVGMKLLKPAIKPKWSPIMKTRPDSRPKSWEHFISKEWD